MSFFKKKPQQQAAPAPVTQKVAASTPRSVINTAAASEAVTDRGSRQGARRGSTKLTGPRGIEEDAKTKKKTLLGT